MQWQYKDTVMQCLNEIKNKKIILIVAHPDDETLWRCLSLQILIKNNDVIILCMTYSQDSERGQELEIVARKMKFNVLFGHCHDPGTSKLLNDERLRQIYIKYFSKYKFDMAITHPPHGEEKLHPHHIQLHQLTKEFCRYHHVKFCFFSKQYLLHHNIPGDYYYLSCKNKRHMLERLVECYKLIKDEKGKHLFILYNIYNLLFYNTKFFAYNTNVDISVKQEEHLYIEKHELSKYDSISLDHFGPNKFTT